MFGYLAVICVFVVSSSSDPIRVPTSWKDEQVFLPYYAVVDGLPSDQNVDAYYPLVASNSVLRDQVVQNDEVIRLFQKMNPNINVFYPAVQSHPTLTAPNNNNYIYSQSVPKQFVNLDKERAQLPPKEDKDTLEGTISRKPEPFKIVIGHQQSGDVAVDHENPGWIPTKPIYPGEGQWAKKGVKHRPHITKNVFKPSPIDEEPSPGINFYNKQKRKFEEGRNNFPKKHKLLYPEVATTKDEDYEETTPEEFVPYRTYAQVRRTESEKHLPRKKSQPRLRESVKDSKIHTIYSEEGYEDSAYDHGDLEKNAESTEDDNVKSNNKTENSDKIDSEEVVDPPKEPLSPLDYDESSNEEDNSVDEDSINEDIEENRSNAILKSNSSDPPRKLLKHPGYNKKIQDDRGGSESNNNDDIIIKFDSKRTKNSYNEEELIDSVMDESKFGKKIKQKRRTRRSAKIDNARQIDQKYPYYKAKNIDHLSSLRYAEISENIPRKIGATMSFYENAEKVECPEMEDVDPIPDRVKNAEDNDVPENGEKQLPSPKLNNLGDHIDCLKTRYFGDDPFDNPLFKEENIEQPSSIFKQTSLEDAARYNSDLVSYQVSPVESSDSSVGNISNSVSSDNSTEETLPEALPYIVRRMYRHPPPRYFKRNKTYSKPHRRPQQKRRKIIGQPPTSTHRTTTNFERISEVHYKDEIKPSEQMNVFADIINNIKNLSKDADMASADVRPVTVKVHSNKNTPHRKRYRHRTTTNAPIESEIGYQNEEEPSNNYHSRLSTTNEPFYYTPNNQLYEEVPKRYRKRKPEVTTEMEYIEEITEKVKVKKRRIKPEYTYNGNDLPEIFSPAISGGFRPILEETISKETNHKAEYHDIDTPVINKYFYIGMRPPPEKPYSHPTFYLKNHIKRKRTNQPPRKRFARSARRGYADIQRGRQKQEEPKVDEVEKQEEEDDYVPHRARNFHYDEKTGKIVYDKKPKEENPEEEEVEYDYIEVEEPTHPPPPKKEERRIWPTKYPDGPNYLDFIKKLKEDPTYVQILDPEPTEKPKEDASTTTISSKVTSSTEIPEFLAILNKVRTDKSYKFIEDPSEKSNKTKTTTPDNLEEKEELIDDASEEYIQEDVQNSPGLQGVFNSESQSQTSDASDSTQNPRNYNPRTSIDTSKYTSIQRTPTTRNRISSRYNSETIETSESVEASTKKKKENEDELVSTTSLESFTIDIPTTSIPSTTPVRTTERTVETTKGKRVLLSRRRGTTTASSSTESTTRATISRQRQRGRSRFSISSTTTEAPIQEATRSRRYLQRRNYANSLVPRNHKPHYSEARNVQNIKPTPRSITVNLLKQTEFTKPETDGNNLGRNDNKTHQEAEVEDKHQPEKYDRTETTLDDVEVFQDYDPNQRHGGNYKYDKGQSEVNDTNSERVDSSDLIRDRNGRKLDDVEAFKDYDKNQKHGGNYKYKKVQIKITRNYRPYTKETREIADGSGEYSEHPQEPQLYSGDSKLASRINDLKERRSDLVEAHDYEETENLSTENENDFYDDTAVAHSRTKKENIPNFVKDPSKRLYYYAPV